MRSLKLISFMLVLSAFSLNAAGQGGTSKTPQEWLKIRTQNIEADPANEWEYEQRARTYTEIGKYAEAFRDYSRAIELNPNFAAAYHGRALLLLKQGKKPEAIEELFLAATIDRTERNQDYAPIAFEKMVELDPKDFRGHRGLGYTILFAHEQWPFYDQAIEHFNKALLLKPNDADSLEWRGTAYLRSEKFVAAAADLTMAIKLRPSKELYTLHAEANEKLGKAALAAADAKKAETLSPEPAMQRAAAARLGGNPALAIAEYTKAIEMGSTKAFRERGKIYARTGKTDLALADFTQARIWDFEDFEVELGRADIYFKQKDHLRALSAYSRIALHAEDQTAKLFALDKSAELFAAINKPGPAKKSRRQRWQILCDQGNKAAADIESKRLQDLRHAEKLQCP